MLELKKIQAGYTNNQVLFDLNLSVKKGKITSLIGPNGSGKSTILKTAYGLLPIESGEIYLSNMLISNIINDRRMFHDISFVSQESRVFPSMSVRENLEMGGLSLSTKELKQRMENLIPLFPWLKVGLKKRVAGTLSGGEQQIVALARAMIAQPKLLLLDEPSLGLSPHFMRIIFEKIREISVNYDTTVLVVEQKVRDVLTISDVVCGLKKGRLEFSTSPEKIERTPELLQNLFL